MAKLKRNKHLNKTQLFIRKHNPWSEPNKKIRELNKQSKNKDLSHGERASAKAKSSAVKRTRDDESIADVQARNKKKVKQHVSKKNADFERLKNKKMSKEAFMKKYPNSGTTRRHMAKMNPVQKRKFLKSLKGDKYSGISTI